MTGAVEIKEDPSHPEGGYALILFHGAALGGSAATLAIESLTDGFDYRGPRRLDVPVRATGDGVEVSIGPDVVGSLKQGLAVNLSFVGTDVEADALWPVLTPLRAGPRRRAMRAAAPRRVVADNLHRLETSTATATHDKRQTPNDVSLADTSSGLRAADDGDRQTKLSDRTTPATSGIASTSDATTSATAAQDLPVESVTGKALITVPPPASGVRAPAVVAIALAAFAIGVGATSILWILKPAPAPRLVTANTDVRFPSPYELLNDLSDHAPDGSAVDVGDASSFRHRSETAASPQDASFWRKWATRGLLNSKTNDAAAILSNFAADLVQARADKPDLAAARFVWEMAAIAKDCAAMSNIATALELGGTKDGPEDPAIWRKRAESCRSQTAPGH